MKAEGQARLELPRSPGYTSIDFCMCDTGCGPQVGGGDDTSKGTRGGHVDGAGSCFAACMLHCILVAALHPQEAPLLSACCYAAPMLCLVPLPPAIQRASARPRC